MNAEIPIGRRLNQAIRSFGIALMVLGAAAILAPWLSAAAMVIVVGLALLVGGAILTVFGLHMRSEERGSAGLVAGLLTVGCGLVLTFQPSIGVAGVGWILVVYFFASGAAEVTAALRVDDEEGGRGAILAGIWTLALGVVMLFGWPVSGARAIGLLVGVKLVASGLALTRLHGRIRSLGEKVAAVREHLR